jgi:integrase
VAEWQTRRTQNPVPSRGCGFKSHLRYYIPRANRNIRRTLGGGKWKVVRGQRVLRHQVASCLAAAGVDRRIIDDILGHQSIEMQHRYRHLAPQVKSQAVLAVFG